MGPLMGCFNPPANPLERVLEGGGRTKQPTPTQQCPRADSRQGERVFTSDFHTEHTRLWRRLLSNATQAQAVCRSSRIWLRFGPRSTEPRGGAAATASPPQAVLQRGPPCRPHATGWATRSLESSRPSCTRTTPHGDIIARSTAQHRHGNAQHTAIATPHPPTHAGAVAVEHSSTTH